MSDAFVAFFVGCVVGAAVGIMFFSFILAASDADRRQPKITKEEGENDDR